MIPDIKECMIYDFNVIANQMEAALNKSKPKTNLFLLVIDIDGLKTNIFELSDSKKIDSDQITKWITKYRCVLLDYKYIGKHKDEVIGYNKKQTNTLHDIHMFGVTYRAFPGNHCKECALFNGSDGCGIKEFHNKGRDHCQNTFVYKKVL